MAYKNDPYALDSPTSLKNTAPSLIVLDSPKKTSMGGADPSKPNTPNIAELQVQSGISPKSVERLIKRGELQIKRVGRRVLIPTECN